MLPELKKLLIVQERDEARRRFRQELQRLPEKAAQAKARFAQEEKTVAAIKQQLTENEMAMKRLELDIETRRTTIQRLKTQQYETRKNEEFRALEHEIERYTQEVAGLEDQQIALMEKAEELKKQVTAATEALAATRQKIQAELDQMKTRHQNLTARVAELDEERAKLVADLEAALLQRYERLFEKKAPAVVPLENGVCGGCHMKVTAATLTAVKAEKVVTSCENCARLLYYAG